MQLEDSRHPDVYNAAMGGQLRVYAEQGIIADISDLWNQRAGTRLFQLASKRWQASTDGNILCRMRSSGMVSSFAAM